MEKHYVDIPYMTTLKLDGLFVSKSPLTTNNIRSFKKIISIGSSFPNLLTIFKTHILQIGIHVSFFVGLLIKWSFCKGNGGIFHQLFHQGKMDLLNGYYAISLWFVINHFLHLVHMVRISRPIKSIIIVANYTSHDLIMIQIHGLICSP